MKYDENFYKSIKRGSSGSAAIISEILIKEFGPKSILDLGCGQGAWAREFINRGIEDVIAVDGDWVDDAKLLVPKHCFHRHDLNTTIDLQRKFDIAISLEVAEHLNAISSDTLVRSLVRHSDLILFSAAVPMQGGTAHINEKWQSYWVDLFSHHGFKCYDFLRGRTWRDDRIEFWYRQNILVFSSHELNVENVPVLDIIHPDLLNFYLRTPSGLWRILMHHLRLRRMN